MTDQREPSTRPQRTAYHGSRRSTNGQLRTSVSTHIRTHDVTPRGNQPPGRTIHTDPRTGVVNRDLDLLRNALTQDVQTPATDVQTPDQPQNTDQRVVSPENTNAMEVDDDSIQNSTGEGIDEQQGDDMDDMYTGVQIATCPCSVQKVGDYLENTLEIEGAQRWCDYVLELPTNPYRMQKIQGRQYDLKRISTIINAKDYLEDPTFGMVLIGLHYLKLQWSNPVTIDFWDFEEWLHFKANH